MRAIKFRAWDIEFKRFSHIALECHVKDIAFSKEYIWQQYTGLDDVNGVEIYEGDIIPYNFNEKKIGIVRYGEYRNPFGDDCHGGHVGFYVEWQDISMADITRKDLVYWNKVSRVIGNIFGTLELLEKT